ESRSEARAAASETRKMHSSSSVISLIPRRWRSKVSTPRTARPKSRYAICGSLADAIRKTDPLNTTAAGRPRFHAAFAGRACPRRGTGAQAREAPEGGRRALDSGGEGAIVPAFRVLIPDQVMAKSNTVLIK